MAHFSQYRDFGIYANLMDRFICQVGSGFPISTNKAWLVKAAPVFKVALIALKLASVVAGVPLPINGIDFDL